MRAGKKLKRKTFKEADQGDTWCEADKEFTGDIRGVRCVSDNRRKLNEGVDVKRTCQSIESEDWLRKIEHYERHRQNSDAVREVMHKKIGNQFTGDGVNS